MLCSDRPRIHLNAPPDTSPSQASQSKLQDAHKIGQSLQRQGVNTSEVLSVDSKRQIENSFDSPQGTGSTSSQGNKPLSETQKVTAQARQSVQKEPESQEWRR